MGGGGGEGRGREEVVVESNNGGCPVVLRWELDRLVGLVEGVCSVRSGGCWPGLGLGSKLGRLVPLRSTAGSKVPGVCMLRVGRGRGRAGQGSAKNDGATAGGTGEGRSVSHVSAWREEELRVSACVRALRSPLGGE